MDRRKIQNPYTDTLVVQVLNLDQLIQPFYHYWFLVLVFTSISNCKNKHIFLKPENPKKSKKSFHSRITPDCLFHLPKWHFSLFLKRFYLLTELLPASNMRTVSCFHKARNGRNVWHCQSLFLSSPEYRPNIACPFRNCRE